MIFYLHPTNLSIATPTEFRSINSILFKQIDIEYNGKDLTTIYNCEDTRYVSIHESYFINPDISAF